MENQITIFSAQEFGEVRTIDNKKTPISYEDSCEILGIKNKRDALKRLNAKGVATTDTYVTNSKNKRNVKKTHWISWGNFARLAATSRKDIAIPFQDWMFDVVMESVMTNGGYMTTQQSASKADFDKAVLQEAKLLSAAANKKLLFQQELNVQINQMLVDANEEIDRLNGFIDEYQWILEQHGIEDNVI